MNDIFLFSEASLLEQIRQGVFENGYYRVRFYSVADKPSEKPEGEIADYFLYPSGGTLRDKDFNIVFYSTKFDTYRGFVHPHSKRNQDAV